MTFTGDGLAFSPDGTRLAYTSTNTVKTYTVNGWTAGTTLLNGGGSDDIFDVEFTPNGRLVSATSIGTAGGDVFVHDCRHRVAGHHEAGPRRTVVVRRVAARRRRRQRRHRGRRLLRNHAGAHADRQPARGTDSLAGQQHVHDRHVDELLAGRNIAGGRRGLRRDPVLEPPAGGNEQRPSAPRSRSRAAIPSAPGVFAERHCTSPRAVRSSPGSSASTASRRTRRSTACCRRPTSRRSCSRPAAARSSPAKTTAPRCSSATDGRVTQTDGRVRVIAESVVQGARIALQKEPSD